MTINSMNAKEYKIRFLKKNEWQLLKKLRLEALLCNPEAFWDDLELIKNVKDEYWHNLSEELTKEGGSRMLICEKSNKIIGFVYGIRKSQYDFSIGGLWVVPNLRSKGFGEMLVQEVTNWIIGESLEPKITLWSPKNKMVNFYKNLGFIQTKNERDNPIDGRTIVEMKYKFS